MSKIFGILGLQDSDRSFVNTIGQAVVYDAVAQVLDEHNESIRQIQNVFVDNEFEEFKFRYKLPGGGYLQKRSGQGPSGKGKAYGQWDVAFPLEDFGDGLGGDDVALAYMTMQELNTHLDTIMIADINTVRLEILKAMFDNVQYTFADRIHGDLTIEPLANGDSVLYPPVIGSDSEATEDHYLASGYAAGSISDTNNPIKTIVADIVHHFDNPTGGSNVIVFINSAQTAAVEGLTDFVEVEDINVRPGNDQDTLVNLPSNVPGRIIGRTNGGWVSEWDYIPAGYMLGVHLDKPKPLGVRIDPKATGLPSGLSLVATKQDAPLEYSDYRHRFGVAAKNRLNGVVMQLTTGSYSVPSGFSH